MRKKQMTRVPIEEQETTINVDYFVQTLDVFTSCKPVYDKLHAEVGEPTDYAKVKGKVVGGKWKVPFNDRKKAKKILSITNVIPS